MGVGIGLLLHEILDCPNGVKGIQPRVTRLAKGLCEEVPRDVMNSKASPRGRISIMYEMTWAKSFEYSW
jgi:hypothetical protein